MTHDELVGFFKPDEYGFCRVKTERGTEGFWFDTVVRVNELIKENSNGAAN